MFFISTAERPITIQVWLKSAKWCAAVFAGTADGKALLTKVLLDLSSAHLAEVHRGVQSGFATVGMHDCKGIGYCQHVAPGALQNLLHCVVYLPRHSA